MTDYLESRRDAPATMGRLFAPNDSDSINLMLEVYEDKCFRTNDWIQIGRITIHPEPVGTLADNQDQDSNIRVSRAICYGFL